MQKILSVSELTLKIKTLLEDNLYYVWVEGEVSNLRSPISGHVYFTLKDAYSQVRCVMFKGQSRLIKFKLSDGMSIILKGMVSVYFDRGEYQILVDYLEPKGIGAQQVALQQLKERLAKEGLFDEKRKRQIPMLPRRVGIITSPTGAAIRDILKVFQRRFANIGVLIYPVRVQGIMSAGEIAAGIAELNKIGDVDVIMLARGGGSQEDMQAFNEESVARAIYNSSVPVVSAVGHEIDYTIADMVSDLRAPTPSAAAEMVIKSKIELIEKIEGASVILKSLILRVINEKTAELHRIEKALIHPSQRVSYFMQRVDTLLERLFLAMTNRFALAEKELKMLISGLNALSPRSVLDRGYSITRKLPSLTIVRNSKNVSVGDELNIILSKGEVSCRVYAKDEV